MTEIIAGNVCVDKHVEVVLAVEHSHEVVSYSVHSNSFTVYF